MYKFVCTNVRTYAGGSTDQYSVYNMTYLTSGDRTYQWRANAVPEFSEGGYLRVNTVEVTSNDVLVVFDSSSESVSDMSDFEAGSLLTYMTAPARG